MRYLVLRVHVNIINRIYEMTALQPPFRANDMKALYEKIIKGQYENISNKYSADLQAFIGILLRVNFVNLGKSRESTHL